MTEKICIGVSSCLLGQRVRFDAQHKYNDYINRTLGNHFNLVGFCPELAVGLPVPRPALRLTRTTQGVAFQYSGDPEADTGDLTARMRKLADRIVLNHAQHLSGFIFKKDSPSCGLYKVRIYNSHGVPEKSAQGVFAARLTQLIPCFPVEEEGRLNDPGLRQNFIDKVLIYHEMQQLLRGHFKVADLIGFHARHKYAIMARSVAAYRDIGRLVASTNRNNLRDNATRYLQLVMQALSQPLTAGKQSNVLLHLMGYLKRVLDAGDKRELGSLIEDYRSGRLPIEAPKSMLRHYFRRHPNEYIARQSYLERREVYYASF